MCVSLGKRAAKETDDNNPLDERQIRASLLHSGQYQVNGFSIFVMPEYAKLYYTKLYMKTIKIINPRDN